MKSRGKYPLGNAKREPGQRMHVLFEGEANYGSSICQKFDEKEKIGCS